MSTRLLVKQRGEAGQADRSTEFILNDPIINLGRDPSCQVLLAEQAVSRKHARITSDGPLYFLEDLGSAFGTEVNGQPLPKGEKRLLANGDLIAIAQFDVTFDRIADLPKEASVNDRTSTLARQVIRDAMRGLNKGQGPFFRIMNGPNEGQRIEINDAQEMVFGRDEKADVLLQNDLVSRLHAKVRRDWEGTHVEDLKSRNGVRVNRKRVTLRTLKDRDELEIGGIRFLYIDPSEVREAPVVLRGEDEGESTAAIDKPSASEVAEAEPPAEPDGDPEEEPSADGLDSEPGPQSDPGEPPDSDVGTQSEESPEDEDLEEEAEEEQQEGEEEPENTKLRLIVPLIIGLLALIALIVLIAVLVA